MGGEDISAVIHVDETTPICIFRFCAVDRWNLSGERRQGDKENAQDAREISEARKALALTNSVMFGAGRVQYLTA